MCTAPFPDVQESHSRSTWKVNVYLFNEIFAPETQKYFFRWEAEALEK